MIAYNSIRANNSTIETVRNSRETIVGSETPHLLSALAYSFPAEKYKVFVKSQGSRKVFFFIFL